MCVFYGITISCLAVLRMKTEVRNTIARSHGKRRLCFLRNHQGTLQSACTFLHSHQQRKRAFVAAHSYTENNYVYVFHDYSGDVLWCRILHFMLPYIPLMGKTSVRTETVQVHLASTSEPFPSCPYSRVTQLPISFDDGRPSNI